MPFKSANLTRKSWLTQSVEKLKRDAIDDDAKHMEKIAHKRSLLMKKVRIFEASFFNLDFLI